MKQTFVSIDAARAMELSIPLEPEIWIAVLNRYTALGIPITEPVG